MPWIAQNKRDEKIVSDKPYLTDELKALLEEKYIPRYPTRKAVLLPALHLIQHEYNWIPKAAMAELSDFLQIHPSEVLDTATFYEEYWLKPKGQYLLQVCRSLTCEICGSAKLSEHLEQKLGITNGQTTPDNRFTLVQLECLGSCGTAPVMLCNEVLHENLTLEKIDALLASLPQDPHDYHGPSENSIG